MKTDEMRSMETTCVTFLDIANREYQAGRPHYALSIFSSIAELEGFTYRRDALRGKAALAKTGKFQDVWATAEAESIKILEISPEPTVFRAHVLKDLAEASLMLGHFDDIDTILEEAAMIFEAQGLTKEKGPVVYLQALVALKRGQFEQAMAHARWAAALSRIVIPDVVPFGLVSQPAESTTELGSLSGLLVGASES